MSISYNSFEIQHTQDDINLFNKQAQKLGLMGVTLIAASGDDGAQGGLWISKDAGCKETIKYGLMASWPAISPYVTAVGATQGIESGKPEITCQVSCTAMSGGNCTVDISGARITSGGGYSGKIARPSWQDGHNTCAQRGIPDVSLAGHSYNIVNGGKASAVDGSSASTPVFGGMISLVNARRKAAGKKTVGWINPAMYQNPSAFFDITEGHNKCGGFRSMDPLTHEIPCCGGYDAKTGWDAATGLGSVNFPKFEAIFESSAPSRSQVVV